MLVTLLARICDDPYDPVFSAPTGVPRRRAADVAIWVQSWWTKPLAWSASSISCGQANGGEEPHSPVDVVHARFPARAARERVTSSVLAAIAL